jgi:RES domain-containing protein
MDPDEVLSGTGTERWGGRFVPMGVKAVYVSREDVTASNEVTARKSRLGATSKITVDRYPRVVFGVRVRLQRHVDFTRRSRSKLIEEIKILCFDPNDLGTSQELGAFLFDRGVQGILFPSVLGSGTNLVLNRARCTVDNIAIANRAEFVTKSREIAGDKG